MTHFRTWAAVLFESLRKTRQHTQTLLLFPAGLSLITLTAELHWMKFTSESSSRAVRDFLVGPRARRKICERMRNFIIQKTFEDDNFLSIHLQLASGGVCGANIFRVPAAFRHSRRVLWVYGLCHHPLHTWFGYKLFVISYPIHCAILCRHLLWHRGSCVEPMRNDFERYSGNVITAVCFQLCTI